MRQSVPALLHSVQCSRHRFITVRFFLILPTERGAKRGHVVITLCVFYLFDSFLNKVV